METMGLKKSKFLISNFGGVLRFIFFYSILFFSVVWSFPRLREYLLPEDNYIFLGIIFVIPMSIFLVLFFSRSRPTAGLMIFDAEATSVVIIGMLLIIAVGTIGILKLEDPRQFIFSMTLMAIYTFYVYRIVKQALKVRRETEEVRKQYGELLEIDQEKTNFITVTSHQLRTPLTEIRWSLESALTKQTDPEAERNIRKTIVSVDKLVKIVNDMLMGAKSNLEKSSTSVNIIPLVTLGIQELETLAKKKNVTVNFSLPAQPVLVNGDSEMLKAALKGIIDNAIRYSPEKAVNIFVESEESKINIKVQDLGIGIPPEEYDGIFKKFFRGKKALLIEPDGSGMGLYNASSTIKRHGGSITFISPPGGGTTFIVSLPKAN